MRVRDVLFIKFWLFGLFGVKLVLGNGLLISSCVFLMYFILLFRFSKLPKTRHPARCRANYTCYHQFRKRFASFERKSCIFVNVKKISKRCALTNLAFLSLLASQSLQTTSDTTTWNVQSFWFENSTKHFWGQRYYPNQFPVSFNHFCYQWCPQYLLKSRRSPRKAARQRRRETKKIVMAEPCTVSAPKDLCNPFIPHWCTQRRVTDAR